MSDAERHAYDEHLNAIMIQNDVLGNAKQEGLAEGLAEGRAQGMEEGLAQGRAEGMVQGRAEGMAQGRAEGKAEEKKSIALSLLAQGIPLEVVSQATGLGIDEIKQLQK